MTNPFQSQTSGGGQPCNASEVASSSLGAFQPVDTSPNQPSSSLPTGDQSGAFSPNIPMKPNNNSTTHRNGEPPSEPSPATPENHPMDHMPHMPEKNEREVTAMTSRSTANPVDETVNAPGTLKEASGDGKQDHASPERENAFAPGEIPTQNDEQTEDQTISKESHTSSPQPQSPGGYPILDELKALLGDKVVLISIPRGKKGPIFKGWQNTTLEIMGREEHQRALVRGNIGVLLGTPSGGLCAVDVDSDQGLNEFLETNPLLRGTLITRGARGGQVWLQVCGEYPPLTKIQTTSGEDFGEWRADGGQSIIHGRHPTGVDYQRINNAAPIKIRFDQIVWPKYVDLPWEKDASDLLIEKFGEGYKLKERLQINDYFFAEKFAQENRILWDPLESEFYRYSEENGLWGRLSMESLKYEMGLTFHQIRKQTGIEDFGFLASDGKMSGLANILKGMTERQHTFKNRPPLIHCQNGMLDLEVTPPVLRNFQPNYYSRNISPIAFDPSATCSRFLEEFLRPALEEEDVELLQIWAGGVLLGKNSAQRFVLLTGTAGGGKSTLVEILENVIGQQNVAQLRTDHLGKQFEMYKFLGKTLLSGKDVDPEFLCKRDASILKSLVGNDLLDAEKKHGHEHFQLTGNFNLVITSNERLMVRLRGDLGAWDRRLIIIEYSKPKTQNRVANLGATLLREEGPGILNWMIQGAIKYLAEVAEYGDIRLTPAQQGRIDRLLRESDSLRQFVEEGIERCGGCDVTADELRMGYYDFCEEMGWRAFPRSDINGSLRDLMLNIHRVQPRNDIKREGKSQRGFMGVRLVERGIR